LSARLPDAQLQVFGHDHGEGGPAQAWWQQTGARGRVTFVGPLAHDRLLLEMARADVFVHTALEESFGAVVAEAMAAGVPVVAGAHSGAVPWVVQDAGRLVDVTRPDEVANALHDLLLDPREASRLGALGRRRVHDNFSAEAVADAYEAEYEAACQTLPLLGEVST